MEDIERRALLGVAGIGAIGALAAMAKAGPLNPPAGAVSSTGKTMQEIADKIARTDAGLAEARTPVSSLTTPGNPAVLFRITQPGSYYLTANITISAANQSAIEITAAGVTLDLNGFVVTGNNTGASISGIIGASGRARIRNGTVTGFSGTGVNLLGAGNSVEDISIHANGTGLSAGTSSRVERCAATTNTGGGIVMGINSVLLASIANANGATGISLSSGTVATACTASSNGAAGFSGGSCIACTARQNGTDGFSSCALLDACISNSNTSDGAGSCTAIHRCSFSSNTGLGANSADLVTDSHFIGNAAGGVSTSTGGAVHRCRFERPGTTTASINLASRCMASYNTIIYGGIGINTSIHCLIEHNNVALIENTDGIKTNSSCMVRENTVFSCGANGVSVTTGCVVTGNMATSNTGTDFFSLVASFIGPQVTTPAGMATATAHANFSV